jgi:hypothetical protein
MSNATNQLTASEFAKSYPTDADWVAAMGEEKITVWKNGDKITSSGFLGTVVSHYRNGMFEIRLPGGVVCVAHTEIQAA